MRCAQCGRDFLPRRRWLRSTAWCSWACRRRMTAEARDVMLWVARWGPSVHRPDTVARYDDLLHRFVTASLRPPAPGRPVRQSYPYVDLDELPLDDPGAPVGRGRRGRRLRPGARSPLR